MDLRDELTKAGNAYDGHVTNGSLAAQVEVIQDWFAHPEKYESALLNRQKSVMTFIREEN